MRTSGQIDPDDRAETVVAAAHHEEIRGCICQCGRSAIETGSVFADVVEVAELDGAGATGDEGERRPDGNDGPPAQSAKEALGVPPRRRGVAVEAGVLESKIPSQRGILVVVQGEDGVGENGTERGARVDGERRGDTELEPIRRAEIDAEREGFSVERVRGAGGISSPIRIGAVQRHVEGVARQGDGPGDHGNELLRGRASGAAEEKGSQ